MRKTILLISIILLLLALSMTLILTNSTQEKTKTVSSNTIKSDYPIFQNNIIPATETKTSCSCGS